MWEWSRFWIAHAVIDPPVSGADYALAGQRGGHR